MGPKPLGNHNGSAVNAITLRFSVDESTSSAKGCLNSCEIGDRLIKFMFCGFCMGVIIRLCGFWDIIGILLGDTWDSGMSKGIPLEFEMLRGLVLPGGFVNFGPRGTCKV